MNTWQRTIPGGPTGRPKDRTTHAEAALPATSESQRIEMIEPGALPSRGTLRLVVCASRDVPCVLLALDRLARAALLPLCCHFAATPGVRDSPSLRNPLGPSIGDGAHVARAKCAAFSCACHHRYPSYPSIPSSAPERRFFLAAPDNQGSDIGLGRWGRRLMDLLRTVWSGMVSAGEE